MYGILNYGIFNPYLYNYLVYLVCLPVTSIGLITIVNVTKHILYFRKIFYIFLKDRGYTYTITNIEIESFNPMKTNIELYDYENHMKICDEEIVSIYKEYVQYCNNKKNI